MLDIGDQAPDFSLPGTAPENGITEYTLSAALTQRPVLVTFYLFDFHPACREQLCALHDLSWFDLDRDVTVFGVSTDSVYSHTEFARQESLEYPLLSDSDGRVADAYGVLAETIADHRQVSRRAAFVVDQSRTVRYAWSAADPSEQPDWDAIKTTLDGLKTES